MEHKWGRNVSEYGVGSLGATLAARLLGEPHVIVTNNQDVPTHVFCVVEALLFPDSPFGYAYLGKVPGHPNFPYGLPVEPDGPV